MRNGPMRCSLWAICLAGQVSTAGNGGNWSFHAAPGSGCRQGNDLNPFALFPVSIEIALPYLTILARLPDSDRQRIGQVWRAAPGEPSLVAEARGPAALTGAMTA